MATNTVVTRDNVVHLPAIIQLAAEEFPGLRTVCFSYPQITGGARTHFREIAPRLSTATAYLLEALPIADQHGIFIVESLKRYEGHCQIPAQSQFAARSRGTVGQDLAGFDLITLRNKRMLVHTRAHISSHEFLER